MANLSRSKSINRVYNLLNIREANDDRAPNNVIEVENNGTPTNLESTCTTPTESVNTSNQSSPSLTNSLTNFLTPRSGTSTSDFYSVHLDANDFNDTVTNQTVNTVYDTCVNVSVRLLKATKSVRQRLNSTKVNTTTGLLNKITKLQRLSLDRQTDDKRKEPKSHDCSCENGSFDGKCLKSFMEMSVQPAEFRNNSQMMTSTPMIPKDVNYDHSMFNVARIKKVELHDLSPRVPDIHVAEVTKERCINNNIRMTNNNLIPPMINGQNATPIHTKHHQPRTMTMPMPENGSVLKKVISYTLDQLNDARSIADGLTEQRPSFVPEKLHFNDYDRFEGKLLVKWISGSITKSLQLNENELKTIEMLIMEILTHLIAAGVLKQIVDNDDKIKDIFSPYQIYQWTHVEETRNIREDKRKEHFYKMKRNVQNENDSTIKVSHCQEHTITSNKFDLTAFQTPPSTILCEETVSPIFVDCLDRSELLVNSALTTDNAICDKHSPKSFVDRFSQTESNEKITCNDNVPVMKTAIEPPTPPVPPPPPPPPLLLFQRNFIVNNSSASIGGPAPAPPPPPPPPPSLPIENCNGVPPPPPPPPPFAFGQSTATKLNLLPNQNVQSNSPTILSSASSFCAPPSINDVPRPPPFPMPAANLWFKTNTLRKEAKYPPKPMINLFWTRILVPKDENEHEIEVTKQKPKLWQKIDETELENADDFTELFARQATPKRPREMTRLSQKKVKKVLDHKRSQSVGIFSQSLYRHRIDSQIIQQAIYNWDTTTIGLDLLQQLLEHRATANELLAIESARDTVTSDVPLDGPEQFLLKFAEISCAPERIACIIFRHEFGEANAQITQRIKIVRNLCTFLMENDNLSDLFAIILTLGNFMNGGNRLRGQADGFGLDVLNKLRDVKSKDKKITLLHFIVKTYLNKRRRNGLRLKDILYPVPDSDDVKSAATVDFIALHEQIDQLQRNLNDIKTKAQIVIDASTNENVQPFKHLSTEFIDEATNQINEQFRQLDACKIIFRETLDYFKHIPKTGTIEDCTPSQFFELWSSFSCDFREYWRKEVAIISAEISQKYKSVASPKAHTPTRAKGKFKPTGLRVRRINQL